MLLSRFNPQTKEVLAWLAHHQVVAKDVAKFRDKIKAGWSVYDMALSRGLVPKPHFFEFTGFHRRAKLLQDSNIASGGLGSAVKVADDLQNAVPIYDTVDRRYAGFNNVLEQLWYGPKAPKFKANEARGLETISYKKRLDLAGWLYVFIVHRVTGSGASFDRKDHGFRNTAVPAMVKEGSCTIPLMAKFIGQYDRPLFTSIGNQPPPFNKKSSPKYRTAGQEYLATVAPKLVERTVASLERLKQPMTIQQGVRNILDDQRMLGCKQYKFVLTAVIMDLAQYFPKLVDPESDCFHGANAVEAVELFFESSNHRGQNLLDQATRLIAGWSDTYPMSAEDSLCDAVRWVENFVIKSERGWATQERIFNSSNLVHSKGRQP